MKRNMANQKSIEDGYHKMNKEQLIERIRNEMYPYVHECGLKKPFASGCKCSVGTYNFAIRQLYKVLYLAEGKRFPKGYDAFLEQEGLL